MSSNFFAALDAADSGDDEAPPPSSSSRGTGAAKMATAATASAKPIATKKSGPKTLVEPSAVDERKRSSDLGDHRHHGRGGGRGGRAAPRNGKRAYERRSGTGRGKEIKKDGDGARNWGSDKTEARFGGDGTSAELYATTEEGKEDDEGVAAGGEEPDEYEVEEEYEEDEVERRQEEEPRSEPAVDNTISYEDYMKAKSAEAPSSGLLAPVQPRQVVDDVFANVKPAMAEEQDFLVGKSKQRKKESTTTTATTQPQPILDLLAGMRVTPGGNNGSNAGGRGRGGRDGRGGGRYNNERGSGGRGGGRDFGGRGGRDFGEEGGRGGRGGGRFGGRNRDGGGRESYNGRGRGGGGRGDNGGRGYGGRGKGKTIVNVNDETAFPSL